VKANSVPLVDTVELLWRNQARPLLDQAGLFELPILMVSDGASPNESYE
jgi:hypothetical protein